LRLPPVLFLSLVFALSSSPAADLAPPAIVHAEINYLLGFIEQSGCQFYRNGSWYDSKKAQAHLREKYQFLAAKGLIKSAEDFIVQAATGSSLSGRAYAIKCGSGPVMTTNQWLREALARFRSSTGQGFFRHYAELDAESVARG
jgi:hypothetical protein